MLANGLDMLFLNGRINYRFTNTKAADLYHSFRFIKATSCRHIKIIFDDYVQGSVIKPGDLVTTGQLIGGFYLHEKLFYLYNPKQVKYDKV
jgi:hypothetical protein